MIKKSPSSSLSKLSRKKFTCLMQLCSSCNKLYHITLQYINTHQKMVAYPLLGVGFCRAVFQAQSCTSKRGPLRACLKSQTNRPLERLYKLYFEHFSNSLLEKDTLPRRYRQVPVQISHLPKSENYLLSLGFHSYNEYQVLTGQGDE